ncbi:carbohydrate kinase family protein [Candidatus Saccharibacteria bacterium]|nr:carbohydrate kinase family protein [Candidatus Saccharibacteria bacterium]
MAEFNLDVLAVGDVVTDAFIKLLDNEAKVEESKSGPRLSMPFATKVPFDHAQIIPAVGNAANAAAAFAKLGLNSGLVSNIGSDKGGREILAALHHSKIDSRFVHINHGRASNYHYVLWYKEERTILIKHEEYDYHWPRFRISDLPKWIYFSSISKNAMAYHDQLSQWLDSHRPIKLAFQPGTFQIEAGTQRLKSIYARTEILAVNKEEAAEISGGDKNNIHQLFDKLHKLGPRTVVISDGHRGAYASDGSNRYKMPIYPDPKPPLERTGAGDSFTSTFVAAIMRGADIQTALLWAPINSMSVVQKVGAQEGLLNARQIDHFLRLAPRSYHPERMN